MQLAAEKHTGAVIQAEAWTAVNNNQAKPLLPVSSGAAIITFICTDKLDHLWPDLAGTVCTQQAYGLL